MKIVYSADLRNRLNRQLVFVAILAVATILCSVPSVSAQTKKKRGTILDTTLTARDGWPIAITYYASTLGKETPVVILLHNRNSSRLVWKGTKGFARRLQENGYAVIAVDLRKHGESKPAGLSPVPAKKGGGAKLRRNDYALLITQDLSAVKRFILKEHHQKKLNIRKTAIIAPEMSAPLAVGFAYRDWMRKPWPDAATLAARTPRGQDIRAIVFLSPEENLPGLRTGRQLLGLATPFWGVSAMIGYGTGDTADRRGRTARGIHQKLASNAANKKRMYLQGYKTKHRGTDMIGRGLPVEKHILGFLNTHLRKLPGEWRDRHNRLDQ